jgi:hypothetical protein
LLIATASALAIKLNGKQRAEIIRSYPPGPLPPSTTSPHGSAYSIRPPPASDIARKAPACRQPNSEAGRASSYTIVAALIDTNILVYRFDPRFPNKQQIAKQLLRQGIADDDIRVPH